MSTHSVTNDTNDQGLIESPFGTAGQFRQGIRSVTELNHLVKSDNKHKEVSSKKGAMFTFEFIKCPCCARATITLAFYKILFSTLKFKKYYTSILFCQTQPYQPYDKDRF
jgi:hypothetical protein